MSKDGIIAITMPKWGLSMQEGKVMEWLAEEGTTLKPGDPVMDIETEKIANTFEALDAGVLRRKVAQPDDVLPIGALLGVIAAADIDDAAIDAFIAEFQASFVPPEPTEEEGDGGWAFVEAGGYRLRYARMGDAAKHIVLVHGFGGDADRWAFTQEPLAAHATVWAFDLPGHGQSGKQLRDGSVTALAEVVVAFMDAVGIDQAELIGHSLGGAIALQTALAHPERVTALALIAPAGLGPDINGEYLGGFVACDNRKEMKQLLQALVADAELVNRTLVADMLAFKRIDGVPAALATIAAGFHDGNRQTVDLRAGLATLGKPVKVIWGSEDRIVPARHAEGLSGAQVSVLEGYGHLVQLEAVAEVNAILGA
ncbi:MAG: acetoin dehydrogenase dihydrolipoyllysine-residue acetyltransferase subunit, partial [Gammaproteobacteria bacterium]